MFARWDAALPVVTYQGPATGIQSTSGTHTHTGCGFGTASTTRTVVAVIGFDNGTGGNLTSCTIGGVTATRVARQTFTSGTGALTIADIWVASGVTGTSGNIVLSGPSGNWTSSVSTYTITDLISTTPTATNGANNGANFNLSVPDDGIVIGVSCDFFPIASQSWTGITQDFATVVTTGPGRLTGASKTQVAAATLTINCTFNNGSWPCVAASFR